MKKQLLFMIILLTNCKDINSQVLLFDTAIVQTSPTNVYFKIKKSKDCIFKRISLTSLNDSNNTQVVNVYFQLVSCLNSTLLINHFDSTYPINATLPFDLKLYSVLDTTLNCPTFPFTPTRVDSVFFSFGQIMPVKLMAFTGNKEAAFNHLKWRTATERNNRGFVLQRSANSIEFSTIGFVPTIALGGNSSAELAYNFTDKKPLANGCYYRLKQIDFDEKFTYSPVVFIKGEPTNELFVTSLFPNPAHQLLNVVLESPVAQKVQIIITDLAGKVVQQQVEELQKGTNNQTVTVARLAKGNYLVKIICTNGCESVVSKFIKQ